MEILSHKAKPSETNIALLLISLAAILLVAVGCSKINQWFGLKDDNPIEEITEKVIESKTGLDIDLTPASPERA